MNTGSHNAYLQRIRRRLWLERILHRSTTAIATGAACLLLMALAVVAGVPISATLIGLATAAIITLQVFKAMLRRPTLAQSARRADRTFKSKSLFTTAHEVERTDSDPTDSGRLVLQRAADLVADEGSRRLPDTWSAPAVNRLALPLLPAFLAIALLVYASGPNDSPVVQELSATGFANLLSAPDPAAETLEASIQRDMAKSPNTKPDDAAARNEKREALNPATMPAETGADESVANKPSTTRLRGAGPGDGDKAGTAANTRTPATAQEEVTLDKKQSIEIVRVGLAMAGRQSGGPEFSSILGAADEVPAELASAAAPPALTAWSSLSAAQSSYARDYLRVRNEQGEVRDD